MVFACAPSFNRSTAPGEKAGGIPILQAGAGLTGARQCAPHRTLRCRSPWMEPRETLPRIPRWRGFWEWWVVPAGPGVWGRGGVVLSVAAGPSVRALLCYLRGLYAGVFLSCVVCVCVYVWALCC